MLTIRREQMKAFEQSLRAGIERRVTAHLRERNRAVGWFATDAELTSQAERGVESGLRFFEADQDLQRYCEIVFTDLGGWNGADHPATALAILSSQGLTAARRIENFERWANRRQGAPRAR